jgi:hypothetical protein
MEALRDQMRRTLLRGGSSGSAGPQSATNATGNREETSK